MRRAQQQRDRRDKSAQDLQGYLGEQGLGASTPTKVGIGKTGEAWDDKTQENPSSNPADDIPYLGS